MMSHLRNLPWRGFVRRSWNFCNRRALLQPSPQCYSLASSRTTVRTPISPPSAPRIAWHRPLLPSQGLCSRRAHVPIHPLNVMQRRCYSEKTITVEEACAALGVHKDATEEEIKVAYIALAKELHPDRSTGDQDQFVKITDSYKRLTTGRKQDDQLREFLDWYDKQLQATEEMEKYRHKMPQHRQFLEYSNGAGTLSQRQKQAITQRAEKAYENVADKRYEKVKGEVPNDTHSVDLQTRVAARRVRMTNAIDRLVEDLIQEAMSKGEFDNLAGKGKPLKEKTFHYLDRTEEKLNEFLINSGCLPQWIELEKEIREGIDKWRARLEDAWCKCGPVPMPPDERDVWEKEVAAFGEAVGELNKKVRNFNLIVPIVSRQRCLFNVDKEMTRVKAIEVLAHGEKPQQLPNSGNAAQTEHAKEKRLRSRLRAMWSSLRSRDSFP